MKLRIMRLTAPTQTLLAAAVAGLMLLVVSVSTVLLVRPLNDGMVTTWQLLLVAVLACAASTLGAYWAARVQARRAAQLERNIVAVIDSATLTVSHVNGDATIAALSRAAVQLVDLLQAQKAELTKAKAVIEQAMRERSSELSALIDFSHKLSGRQDVRSLMTNMLAQIRSAVAYQTASIWMREPDGVVLSSYQVEEWRYTQHLEGIRIPDNHARAYQVMEACREPVVVNRSRRGLLAFLIAQVTDGPAGRLYQRARSWMMTPLITGGQMIGALRIDCDTPDFFTPERERLLVAIGDQAALAIEHARLAARAKEVALISERNRIARDLHDSVSQNLFAAAMISNTLTDKLTDEQHALRADIGRLQLLNRGALAEMRLMLFELRPDALSIAPLHELLQHVVDAATSIAQCAVELQMNPALNIEDPVKTQLYRITQEAISNAIKHSGASTITIAMIQVDGQFELSVSDNGKGFDVSQPKPGHFGMESMRQRAAETGAALTIMSEHDRGTIISVTWPQQSPLTVQKELTNE